MSAMPPRTTTTKMMHRAGELRHDQTEAEAELWSRLRAHRMGGIHFRRQHAIGNTIVDFCAVRPCSLWEWRIWLKISRAI
jgi:very-short-patch-repair endonuclease